MDEYEYTEYQKARALALSGSLDGFDQLRNKFGITMGDLIRHGAETDGYLQLRLSTPEHIEKARKAIEAIEKARQ